MATQQRQTPCSLPGVFVNLLEGCCSDEEWCLLMVGPPFQYTLPNFEVLAVEFRQTRVERTVEGGELEAERYDAFIRNDPGLSRNYPATLLTRNTFFIEVCKLIVDNLWCVCVCMCACMRACVHVCVRACE